MECSAFDYGDGYPRYKLCKDLLVLIERGPFLIHKLHYNNLIIKKDNMNVIMANCVSKCKIMMAGIRAMRGVRECEATKDLVRLRKPSKGSNISLRYR